MKKEEKTESTGRIRKAFVMSVNADQQEAYRVRHNPIWPDLEELLKSQGVHSYSIFIHEQSSQLFAYVEFEDEEKWQSIATTDICKKWWNYMSDIMPSNADGSPLSQELRELFHLV